MRPSVTHRAVCVFRMLRSTVSGSCRCSLVLAAGMIGPAALAADADNGKRLAERWCASCHVVTPDQKTASADAPPFASIAHMSGFNAEKLVFFLLEPHPKMPSMSLTRNEANDIAAYIGTFAK
jgi:mono/diheme cytochrome c family protein